MKFSFEVGQQEPHTVEFYWGQMFGNMQIKVDKRVIEKKNLMLFSPSSLTKKLDVPASHKWDVGLMEIQLVESWTFQVGIYEKHSVRIEKERAKFFSGLRPHAYRVFIDDELFDEYKGY